MPSYDPQLDIIAGETIKSGRDLFTRTAAEAQAAELNTWWHSRGHPTVQHWVEPAALSTRLRPTRHNPESSAGIWVVRSNLINGLPPKA
jgi:hypothetical protein